MSDLIETPTTAVLVPVAIPSLDEWNTAVERMKADAGIVLVTEQDMERAAEIRTEASKATKALTELRLSITRPIDAQKAEVMDKFRPFLDELTRIEQGLRARMDAFVREQFVAAERDRKAADESARLALVERKRLDAEKAREEGNEQQAKAIEDAPAFVIKGANVPEAEEITRGMLLQERERAIADAIENGDVEKARELEAAPAPTVYVGAAIGAVAPAAKPKGYTPVETWGWELEDIDKVPREYLMLNEKLLDAKAKSEKGKAKVAGIKFVKGTSTRRK